MKIISFLIVIITFICGCAKPSSGGGTFSCSHDYCSFKAPDSEIKKLQDTLVHAGITGFQQHCSGLFYKIIDSGKGAPATICNTITAAYVGRFFYSSNAFDSSSGTTFALTQVITGWSNGVPLIRSGGHIQLFIPPSLGYGSQAYQGIPANSYLFFDVYLQGVQ